MLGLPASSAFSEPRVASGPNQTFAGQKDLMKMSLIQLKASKALPSLGVAYLLLFSGGCAPKVTVTPLQRAYLADYLMRPDRDKLAVKMYDHAFYSREASRGGRGVGGGGCGCN